MLLLPALVAPGAVDGSLGRPRPVMRPPMVVVMVVTTASPVMVMVVMVTRVGGCVRRGRGLFLV